MSAFSTMHDRKSALFERVPEKRGELYSEKLLLANTHKKSAPRKNGQTKSVDKWKFPKIPCIDINGHLAEAFRVRSMKMKAWKACLIHRMNTIRKSHASKLSQTYNTRKGLYMNFALWKLYVKRIVPE